MTPKEKALALYNECGNAVFNAEYHRDEIHESAKKLALSWVDEIICAIEQVTPMYNFYWQEVKSELQSL